MRAVRPSSVIILPLNDTFWFHIYLRFPFKFVWNFKRSGPFLSLLPVTGFITFSTLFASKEIMIRVKIAQISVQRQTQKYDPCKSCWNIWTTVPTRNCTVGLYSSIFLAGWEWSIFYVFAWARACTNIGCFYCLVALSTTGLFTKFYSSWNRACVIQILALLQLKCIL